MQTQFNIVALAHGAAISCVTLLAMKIAPLAALLCALPLAGCYVVQYPGGALTFSQDPNAPQALRAAPGSAGAVTDVSTAPVPTPSVSAAPVQAQPAAGVSMPPPPPGKSARQAYPNGSPVPPDYRPGNGSGAAPPAYPNGSPVPPDYRPSPQRAPVYPNGSPVPPDYVPPQSSQVPSNAPVYTTYPTAYPAYSAYPTYATYPTNAPYPAYAAYPTYPAYPAYPAFPDYAPFYPGFAPSPWVSNVSLSFSWGRGWGGGWGGHWVAAADAGAKCASWHSRLSMRSMCDRMLTSDAIFDASLDAFTDLFGGQ